MIVLDSRFIRWQVLRGKRSVVGVSRGTGLGRARPGYGDENTAQQQFNGFTQRSAFVNLNLAEQVGPS